jgi:hypothetical protein
LANGGGVLHVPLFVLVLRLTMPESAETRLVVIAVLGALMTPRALHTRANSTGHATRPFHKESQETTECQTLWVSRVL